MFDKAKRSIRARALELSLYVAGAGAFGVLLRWLQDQTAFNELGLADPSAFHVMLPLYLLAVSWVFLRFIRRFERERRSLPGTLWAALETDMVLLVVLRWVFCGIIGIGALILFATTESDPYPGMQRLLSLLCLLSGGCLAYLLQLADEGRKGLTLLKCLLSMEPVVCCACWLILIYRSNSINSVPWAYVLEVATAMMGMMTFFRLGGFVFGAPQWKKILFDTMLCAVMMIMSLADDRYIGMQIVLLGWALMLMLYNWNMIENLRQGEAVPPPPRKDGLERLAIPIDKMREFNRLPTAEEVRAAEEKRRSEGY